MNVVTKRMRIETAADRWKRWHRGRQWDGTKQRAQGKALGALDLSTATEDDVAAIVGNRHLTWIHCDQCKNDVDAAVEFDDAGEYVPTILCRRCLREALDLLEGHGSE